MTADYDLSETVEYLESKGIRVIGRLVAFRDPIYADAAWAAGDRDQVVQTPGRRDVLAPTAASRTSPTTPCGSTTGRSRSRPSRWA